MIEKWKKNMLFKGYSSLPLWGKIAVPVGGILVLSFVYSMMKNILVIGLGALVLYLILSAYFYIKDNT